MNHRAGPIGLGFRVPMIVISPFSVGGYRSSQVYDHTSTIQFMERMFGVEEPNITEWRRQTCGDLTGSLYFRRPPGRHSRGCRTTTC